MLTAMLNKETVMEEDNVIRTREDAERILFAKPFFAFLDILGFRELVKNNSHQELVTLYQKMVNFQVDFYKQYHEQNEKDRAEDLKEYFHPTDLKLVNISDSILVDPY